MAFCSLHAFMSWLKGFIIAVLICLLSIGFADDTQNKHVSIRNSTQHEECSFTVSVDPCQVARILVSVDNIKSLHDTLVSLSNNVKIHKFAIEGLNVDHNRLGTAIDAFITSSPWWVIKREVMNIQKGDSIHHNIVLMRYKISFEPLLRYMAAKQYPPPAECGRAPFVLGRMISSGWGSQAEFHTIISEQTPHAIYNVWYTRNNLPKEHMQICNAEDCNPGLINKWECVFLPMTNCSLDHAAFVQCHDPDKCMHDEFPKVVNISRDGGVYITSNKPEYETLGRLVTTDYFRSLERQYRPWISSTAGERDMRNNFMNALKSWVKYDGGVFRTLFMFGSLFRPNYNLRQRVVRKLEEMAAIRDLPFELHADECVAIHIRRGDRMMNVPIDMRDYCNLSLRNGSITRNSCTEALLKEVPLGEYGVGLE